MPPSINLSDELCAFAAVAERFAVDQSTVRRWALRGTPSPNGYVKLAAFKSGRQWRTSWKAVEAFIAAQNVAPGNN